MEAAEAGLQRQVRDQPWLMFLDTGGCVARSPPGKNSPSASELSWKQQRLTERESRTLLTLTSRLQVLEPADTRTEVQVVQKYSSTLPSRRATPSSQQWLPEASSAPSSPCAAS